MEKDEADKLLDQWGEWSRGDFQNGHAKTNIIGRIMVEGAGASHDSEYQGIIMPESVEKCEKAITLMNLKMKRVTKCRYLWQLTIKDSSRRCRCSESTYRQRLDSVMWFVAGSFI